MEYGQLRINTISICVNGASSHVELLINDEVATQKLNSSEGSVL